MNTALIILNIFLIIMLVKSLLSLDEVRETTTRRHWNLEDKHSTLKMDNEVFKQQIASLKYRVGKLAEANRNMRRRVASLERPMYINGILVNNPTSTSECTGDIKVD